MINEYDIATSVTVCKNNGNNECSRGSSTTWTINPHNSWNCVDYLSSTEVTNGCEVSPSSQTITASSNNENTIVQYIIEHYPTKAPECTCREWYVTFTSEDKKTNFSEYVGCDSDKSLTLPPNSNTNTYYTISAQLHSYRKY